MADEAKRTKSKMFTSREVDIIVDFMKENASTMRSSHASAGPGAAQKVNQLWFSLVNSVNACGSGPRTLKQVKEKWRNIVRMII
jgi:cytochrome b